MSLHVTHGSSKDRNSVYWYFCLTSGRYSYDYRLLAECKANFTLGVCNQPSNRKHVRAKLFMDSRDGVIAIVMIRGYAAGKGKKLFFSKLADPTWFTHKSHVSWVEVHCPGLQRLQDAVDLLLSKLRMGGSLPLNLYTPLWRGQENVFFIFQRTNFRMW